MDTKRIFLALLGTIVLSSNAIAAIDAAIVKLNDDGKNYIYTATKISAGDTIYFQFPKNNYEPDCCKRITWQATKLMRSDSDAIDNRNGSKLFQYQISVAGISGDMPFVGIAVIGKSLVVTPRGKWRLKARAGSDTEDLQLCTSQEGVHVQGEADDRRQSDLYLYLGYDIENPTCPISGDEPRLR